MGFIIQKMKCGGEHPCTFVNLATYLMGNTQEIPYLCWKPLAIPEL